jgi:osmotically-inducible protein OsmY
MRFLFRLFLLFVLIAVVWVFRGPIMGQLGRVAGTSRPTRGETPGASGTTDHTTRGKVSDLDLSVETIAQELRATGRVVRRKVAEAGRQLEESTRDTRTTARLKARFALDPELKAREIHVDTADGRVTLTGRVDSAAEVARAIRMAVEEDDVLEVTSTLQVSAGGAHPSGVEVAPQVTPTPLH